jgi:hypothetical protein
VQSALRKTLHVVPTGDDIPYTPIAGLRNLSKRRLCMVKAPMRVQTNICQKEGGVSSK